MFAEGYAKHYDLFNRDKNYKKEIEFVYRWANKPKSIFDIGAGTGNYWKYYPKGLDIVGIDKSPFMPDPSRQIFHGDITKYEHTQERFDCATALFDVVNYIPKHDWWKNIPVKKGGYFIFDVWNKLKVDMDGFKETSKMVGNCLRTITPLDYNGKFVDLKIQVSGVDFSYSEKHRMYIYSDQDIAHFCGKEFTIIKTKPTKKWQEWYLLKRE